MEKQWDEAKGLPETEALKRYMAIINDTSAISENDQKIKENAVYAVADIYVANKNLTEFIKLISGVRPLAACMPQARVAKIIRVLYERLPSIPGGLQATIDIGKEIVEWCKAEKRTFLKHRLQTKLSSYYMELGMYNDALKLIDEVMHEVRKLEDMMMLVDIHLVETKVYISLENIAKSKPFK